MVEREEGEKEGEEPAEYKLKGRFSLVSDSFFSEKIPATATSRKKRHESHVYANENARLNREKKIKRKKQKALKETISGTESATNDFIS